MKEPKQNPLVTRLEETLAKRGLTMLEPQADGLVASVFRPAAAGYAARIAYKSKGLFAFRLDIHASDGDPDDDGPVYSLEILQGRGRWEYRIQESTSPAYAGPRPITPTPGATSRSDLAFYDVLACVWWFADLPDAVTKALQTLYGEIDAAFRRYPCFLPATIPSDAKPELAGRFLEAKVRRGTTASITFRPDLAHPVNGLFLAIRDDAHPDGPQGFTARIGANPPGHHGDAIRFDHACADYEGPRPDFRTGKPRNDDEILVTAKSLIAFVAKHAGETASG